MYLHLNHAQVNVLEVIQLYNIALRTRNAKPSYDNIQRNIKYKIEVHTHIRYV